jgi:cell division protein FtsZ
MSDGIPPGDSPSRIVIKVIGAGGGGCHAVAGMMRGGVQGVEFICADADARALAASGAPLQIRLGHAGRGTGANPEQGRLAAEAAREEIRAALAGAHMVFIIAGLGGGTGTGAGPIVAEAARELGALTVAAVTTPFAFEGHKRMKTAREGIAELSRRAHAVIVTSGEKLCPMLDEDATQEDCFKAADGVLRDICAAIAEIINAAGMVQVDFEDVKTIMSKPGQAMVGAATARGANRAREAAEKVIACPLLEGMGLRGARGVLVNITANRSLKMREVKEIMHIIHDDAPDEAHVIFGMAYDESLGDDLRVTMITTGLDYK